MSGNWEKAREVYLSLNAKTRGAHNLETLNVRLESLVLFARKCLARNGSAGNDQALADVQTAVEELKKIQPNAPATLALQVDLYRIRNQLDEAAKLIQSNADRPDVARSTLLALAELAERIDKPELAEEINKKYAGLSNVLKDKYPLVVFLSRHNRLKDALDVCEPFWANPSDRENAAIYCSEAVGLSPTTDPQQLERAAAMVDKALGAAETQNLTSTPTLLCALGSIRERQERFSDAELLYKRAIEKGNIAVAYNNLAWLMALRNEGAEAALAYINRAINSTAGRAIMSTRGPSSIWPWDSPKEQSAISKQSSRPIRNQPSCFTSHKPIINQRIRERPSRIC